MNWNDKMTVMSCQVDNGILSYIIEDNKVYIMGFEGAGLSLVIPETIEGTDVCVIGKKAFLGNRSLQHITLPGTIEWIGDWAFGNCTQLRRMEFPRRSIRLGKGLFTKDERLYEITCNSSAKQKAFPGRLLAAAVTLLDAEYLLDMTRAGSAEWYEQFDNRLLAMLMEPAENALKDLVYCAEEDMGAKQEACLEAQACRKASMALLRLAYSEGISEKLKETLKTVPLDKEGIQTRAAWKAVKEAHGKEQTLFLDMILKLNGIREENLSAVLEDLGDTHVELKAHLLKAWEQQKEQTHTWDKFML